MISLCLYKKILETVPKSKQDRDVHFFENVAFEKNCVHKLKVKCNYIVLSLQVIESFLMEKCMSCNEKPMESKAFELNLDYTFLATSPDCSDATDSKNNQHNSLKARVSRVVTGNI